MATGVLAVLGGILALAGQLLMEYFKGAPERKRKADALARLELDQTTTAMDTVDRELDGVQPDQRKPILLSPDDHL
jgi:hypothetical protein